MSWYHPSQDVTLSLKLRKESKEVSQLRDEVKESALKRGWRYTEKEEEVQGGKGCGFSCCQVCGAQGT